MLPVLISDVLDNGAEDRCTNQVSVKYIVDQQTAIQYDLDKKFKKLEEDVAASQEAVSRLLNGQNANAHFRQKGH